MARPGEEEQEAVLREYDHRLAELKEKLAGSVGEREAQLKEAQECEESTKGLLRWMDEGAGELEGLKVCDPRSSVIAAQQQKCEV